MSGEGRGTSREARRDEHELLAAAQAGDRASRERLLASYRRFAERLAERIVGGPRAPLAEDGRSAALLALHEAVDAYRPGKGMAFRTFAARRVVSRILDLLRSERPPLLSLDDPGPAGDEGVPEESPLAAAAAWERWQRDLEAQAWAEEFQRFEQHLRSFGLTLDDLAASSPRHRDARATLVRAARRAAADPDVVRRLWMHRQLPLRELQRITGLSRKVLERGRRYLVALLIVLSDPELERMRSYVPQGEADGRG